MSARRSSLIALTAFTLASLAGCKTFEVELRHDKLLPASQFQWRDARPFDQRESGWESLAISSCAYGAYRIGDDKFTPNQVAMLRSDLEQAMGAELAGRKVSLKAYTVHLNNASGYRGMLANSVFNDKTVHGCAADDLRGSYVAEERTTKYAPLIVVIDVEVDGRKVHARRVECPQQGFSIKSRREDDPVWHDLVSQAIALTTDQLVTNIRAALAAP